MRLLGCRRVSFEGHAPKYKTLAAHGGHSEKPTVSLSLNFGLPPCADFCKVRLLGRAAKLGG